MSGHTTLSEWLDVVSRPSAVFASGSVLAVTCAQSWALVAMIAGLASKHQSTAALRQVQDLSRRAQVDLLLLADQDATAVQDMMKNPDSIASIQRAAQIPMQVLTWAIDGQGVAADPDLTAYRPARLDLACAESLFAVVVRNARSLVLDNAAHLPPEHQRTIREHIAQWESPNRE